MTNRVKIDSMKPLRALLAVVATVGLLSGCTLIGHLGAPTGETTGGGDGTPVETDTAGHSANPTESGAPVETIVAPDGPDGSPERINVQLELGVPHEIVGKEGDVVGTITVTGVDDEATCPSSHADASKNGKFVIANFELTAEESLRDQSDPWYGRNFDLSTIDVLNPYTGTSVPGGLDYDCLPASDRLSTVQPGSTETGSLAYDVAKEQFAIGWFYGHQYFYVPPSVWGATQ